MAGKWPGLINVCARCLSPNALASWRCLLRPLAITDYDLPDIAARTGWNDEVVMQVAKQAQEATALGEAAAIMETDGVLVSNENFERLSRITIDEVKRYHEREPLARGLARETLRERHFTHAAPEIFRAVISRA